MSKNRGNRGKSKKKFAVQLIIRNDEQLRRTLDLCNVKANKPHVNDIICDIVERLERERNARIVSTIKSWRSKGCGWPSDAMLYNCMGEDYLDDGYDPYEEVFDGLSGKSSRKMKLLNKKLFKGKNNKKKKYQYDGEDDYWENRGTMYTNGEWSDDELDDEDVYEPSYKCIKFYSDINNEMSVREFHSLKEFNDFCSENGYYISTVDYGNLVNWSVVHCCLDPISAEYGENEIITDNSYGALYWTVSDDTTKATEHSALGARTFAD